MVRKRWDTFEQEQFAMQAAIEEVAVKLFGQDEELAISFLTTYSNQRAMQALEMARELANKLKTVHWAH